MKRLHLVGLTTDRKNLILSTRRGSKSGTYLVEIDESVVEAIGEAERPAGRRAARPRPGGRSRQEARSSEEPAAESSALSVRDIQARLRRGRRLEEVAAEAGVSREWVERFAAPVLAERAAVIEELREATFSAPRKGTSAASVVESVARHLVDRGIGDVASVLEAGWSARQLEGDEWLVTLRYRYRNRDLIAQWRLHRRTGTVHALNRLAADLAFIDRADDETPPVDLPPALRTRPLPSRSGRGGEPTAQAAPPARRPSRAKAAVRKRATVRRSADDVAGRKTPPPKRARASEAAARRPPQTPAGPAPAAPRRARAKERRAEPGGDEPGGTGPRSSAASVAQPPYVSNGAPRTARRAHLFSEEDPFAELDLTTGFTPRWRGTTSAAPPVARPAAPASPRSTPASAVATSAADRSPPPVRKLARGQWPAPATPDQHSGPREMPAPGPAAKRRRREPLRAER